MCFRPPFHRRWWSTPATPPAKAAPRAPQDDTSDGDPQDNVFLPEHELADETEAFLEGRLAELVVEQGRPLRAWLIVNRLAHADVEDLFRTVRTAPPAFVTARRRPGDPTWWATERSLILRLLSAGADLDDVRRVQREELVPLELSLLSRSRDRSLSLDVVVAEIGEALGRHRLDR